MLLGVLPQVSRGPCQRGIHPGIGTGMVHSADGRLPAILGRINPPMIDHRDVVGVTELASSSSRLAAEAAGGRDVIVSKNNRPIAAPVGMERLQQLQDREENLALLALGLTRIATDNGNRTDLDDFINELALTDEVAALNDEAE